MGSIRVKQLIEDDNNTEKSKKQQKCDLRATDSVSGLSDSPPVNWLLFRAAVEPPISVRGDKEMLTGLLLNTHTNQLYGQTHGVKGRKICV